MNGLQDWWVPGSPKVARVIPPGHYERCVVQIQQTPPSMNTNAIRSNWRGFHKAKKAWEEEIGQMLLVMKLPRRNQRVIAGALIRFPKRAAKRDSGNFAGVIEKAMGDALVVSRGHPLYQRYIPDDDEDHYHFCGVEFEPATGPPLTRIFIYYEPEGTTYADD